MSRFWFASDFGRVVPYSSFPRITPQSFRFCASVLYLASLRMLLSSCNFHENPAYWLYINLLCLFSDSSLYCSTTQFDVVSKSDLPIVLSKLYKRGFYSPHCLCVCYVLIALLGIFSIDMTSGWKTKIKGNSFFGIRHITTLLWQHTVPFLLIGGLNFVSSSRYFTKLTLSWNSFQSSFLPSLSHTQLCLCTFLQVCCYSKKHWLYCTYPITIEWNKENHLGTKRIKMYSIN